MLGDLRPQDLPALIGLISGIVALLKQVYDRASSKARDKAIAEQSAREDRLDQADVVRRILENQIEDMRRAARNGRDEHLRDEQSYRDLQRQQVQAVERATEARLLLERENRELRAEVQHLRTGRRRRAGPAGE